MFASPTGVLVCILASLGFAQAFSISSVEQATAITLIKQTINAFPMVVDGHLWDQFDEVFTPNATANLHPPNNQIYYGIPEIVQAIHGLTNVSSQHGFTTQYVELLSPATANATTYIFANFFGKGTQTGQMFTLYGIYTTLMKLTPVGWRIDYMELDIKNTVGDQSIAFPDGTG